MLVYITFYSDTPWHSVLQWIVIIQGDPMRRTCCLPRSISSPTNAFILLRRRRDPIVNCIRYTDQRIPEVLRALQAEVLRALQADDFLVPFLKEIVLMLWCSATRACGASLYLLSRRWNRCMGATHPAGDRRQHDSFHVSVEYVRHFHARPTRGSRVQVPRE